MCSKQGGDGRRWGECGYRGGNSPTLRAARVSSGASLASLINGQGRAGGSAYIQTAYLEGGRRRCGRSSSVWSVGQSSSVL